MKDFLKENWFKFFLLILLTLTICVWFWFQYINFKLQSCIQGGRYLLYSEGGKSGLSASIDIKTVWWSGRWNFEREECEKEEARYQSIRETRNK